MSEPFLWTDTPRLSCRLSPRWEPEPLRWLAVRGLYATYRLADRLEARPGAGPSRLAWLADRVTRKP